MPPLDLRTIFTVASAVSLSLAALTLGLAVARRMSTGLLFWILSQLAIGFGSGLIAARGILPAWSSVVAGNVLLLVGNGLVAEGFLGFYRLRRRLPAWLDMAVVLATGALLWTKANDAVNFRIVIVGIGCLYFVLRTAFEPLSSAEGRKSRAQWVLSTICVGAAILLLVRSYWAAVTPRYLNLFSEGWTAVIPGLALILLNSSAIVIGLYLVTRRDEAQLREALATVKTLSGLLPICSHCHKIRTEAGLWQRVDEYIAARSSAQFTHGICPQCFVDKYPENEGS
ncbi:MAG TPA: hypothetical protein VFG59_09130 [Anaeromyxobacter sp.]|nr:hypothetical protein [Anaeromyxobacter sp.]